ncbi:MAG: hypothetical protein ACI8WB_002560 [Phenylobacterium sp.]|jgi:hypothetical protein
MTKSTVFEFEATANAQGKYTCHAFTEMASTEHSNPKKSYQSAQQDAEEQAEQQAESVIFEDYLHRKQNAPQSPYHSIMTDQIFQQSYHNNFASGQADYVSQMRNQFEQMRQDMLDQMESFTHIKNSGK